MDKMTDQVSGQVLPVERAKPSTGKGKTGRLASRIVWLISIVLAVGVTAWAVWTSVRSLRDYRLSWGMLGAALAVRMVALLVIVYLWNAILSRMGGPRSLRQDFRLYCYTNIAKRLPTPLWLVNGRIYLYKKETGSDPLEVSVSTGIEILLTLVAGLVVSLLFLPFGLPGLPIYVKVLAIALALVTLVVFSSPRPLCWLGQKVGRLIRQDIQLGHTRWCDLLYWNILYALSWVLGGAILYFLVGALLPVTWSLLPRLVWAWAVSGLIGFVRFLIPFLLAARELSLAVIMAPFVPLPLAVVAAALSRLCLIAGDLLGILLSWLIR